MRLTESNIKKVIENLVRKHLKEELSGKPFKQDKVWGQKHTDDEGNEGTVYARKKDDLKKSAYAGLNPKKSLGENLNKTFQYKGNKIKFNPETQSWDIYKLSYSEHEPNMTDFPDIEQAKSWIDNDIVSDNEGKVIPQKTRYTYHGGAIRYSKKEHEWYVYNGLGDFIESIDASDPNALEIAKKMIDDDSAYNDEREKEYYADGGVY